MARLPRLAIAEQLHYVCQMGHSGSHAFWDAQDVRAFQDVMREAASRYPVQLHAYMLLPDRYGLLVTPLAAGSLSVFIQAIGRSYARHFNRRHQRTGTVWNGRYQVTVLEATSYYSDVMTWMAGQSARVSESTGWSLSSVSSTPHYLGSAPERCITPHTLWWSNGNTPFERESAFQQQLDLGLTEGRASELTRSLGRDWVLGGQQFLAFLGGLTDRRLIKRSPGRPRIG